MTTSAPFAEVVVARRHRGQVPLRLARIMEQGRPWPRIAPAWVARLAG